MHQSARIPIGTILLLVPLFANGEAFLYFDTASYLSRPDKVVGLLGEATGLWTTGAPEGTGAARAAEAAAAPHGRADHVIGGRSVFYGAAAWLAAAAGAIEAMAVMQAAVTVAVLSLLWDLLPRRSEAQFHAAVLALAVLTPAGFFAALITPDAFAPLVIVCPALLACAWPALTRGARWFLAAVLVFGLLSHTSHVVVAACLVAIGGVLAALWPPARGAISGRGLAAGAGAICIAVAATVSVDAAAKRLTGLDVIPRPHLTAHLVDGGPGAAWVARRCGPAGGPAGGAERFAVCAYADRLPADWIAFLFAKSPETGIFVSADTAPAARRALSDQDAGFALAVLRDDPAGTAAFLGGDALRQVAAVRFDDVPLAGEALRARAAHFPFGIAGGTGGRIASSPAALDRMSAVAEVSAVSGALALAAGLALLARAPRPGALVWVGAAVVLGVVLNAAVCGALASPYDRFQSRVIFLVPALAVVVWTALLRVPDGPFRAAPAETRAAPAKIRSLSR